jgi:hypothetical protein
VAVGDVARVDSGAVFGDGDFHRGSLTQDLRRDYYLSPASRAEPSSSVIVYPTLTHGATISRPLCGLGRERRFGRGDSGSVANDLHPSK